MLLGKWWWKFLNDTKWGGTEFILFNYGSSNWNLYPPNMNRVSFFWKGVLSYLPAFHSCIRSDIWSGSESLFRKDRWLCGRAPMNLWPELFSNSNDQNAMFKDLEHWLGELPFCFDEKIISFQGERMTGSREERDAKWWTLNNNGLFSVKSFYNFLNDGGMRCHVAKVIWKSSCPRKINILN